MPVSLGSGVIYVALTYQARMVAVDSSTVDAEIPEVFVNKINHLLQNLAHPVSVLGCDTLSLAKCLGRHTDVSLRKCLGRNMMSSAEHQDAVRCRWQHALDADDDIGKVLRTQYDVTDKVRRAQYDVICKLLWTPCDIICKLLVRRHKMLLAKCLGRKLIS